MATTFHSFAPIPQHNASAASPPQIGSVQPKTARQKEIIAPSASAEIARLCEEYQAEAGCLAEQLDLCGIQKEALSSKARLSVQLLAGIASMLHLSKPQPELVLAAWAAMVVKESKAVALKHKLQQEAEALAQRRQAAQVKLKALQQVLHDVQMQQKRWSATVQEESNKAAQMREKNQEYNRLVVKTQKKLSNNGFTPEVTHAALIAKHAQVTEMQQRLADMEARLKSYHHLPPSMLGAQMMLQNASDRLKEKQEKLQSRLADMH